MPDDDTPENAASPENPAIEVADDPAPDSGEGSVAPAPYPDVPAGTIMVPMEFTPGAVDALRTTGFLTGEPTPDAIATAAFGMMAAAWRAGITADAAAALDQATAAAEDAEARRRDWLLKMSRATSE